MYQRILVPLDGSATAERGMREAIRLASHTKGLLVARCLARESGRRDQAAKFGFFLRP